MIRDGEGDIVGDPNREDDEQYIAKLVSKVVTVSVETVNIVRSLFRLNLVWTLRLLIL
jgi:predicted helicase